MHCREMREQLHILSDGERLASARQYAEVPRHWLRCPGCRAVGRRWKRDRRMARHMPSTPVPSGLKQRVLMALPDLEPAPAAARSRPGRRWLPVARASIGVALALLLASLVPWRGSRTGPAAVEAAVERANTWHLVGWKLAPWRLGRGQRRVRWEIWGRRSPFFYREQLGDGLNFDDGRQRIRIVQGVRIVRGRPTSRLYALRLEPGQAPNDTWRGLLTTGAAWRDWGVLRETRNRIVVRAFHASGMSGPFTGEDSYFTIDKRTWLPTRYEHRVYHYNSTAPALVTEALDAQYDVPIPDSVTAPHLPPGMPLVDTLATPADPSIPPPGGNVQRAHGLTVQVTPLAMNPDGNILVRVRAWLGNLKLGVEGSGTWNDVETDPLHGKGDQARDTAYHTDDGRRYVDFMWPGVNVTSFLTGDDLLPLVPLEPRPARMALPRSLKLYLLMIPQVIGPQDNGTTRPLFEQSFVFTVPLPQRAAPVDINAYLPRGYRQRFGAAPGVDASTLASNIASARANEYGILHHPDRAIYWARQSLVGMPPVTSAAQIGRLDLAGRYRDAGDDRHAAQWYREVIAISRQHPPGWDRYPPLAKEIWREYAWQARGTLEYMASHPSRRLAWNHPAGGSQPQH